jgi:hypothetical protein
MKPFPNRTSTFQRIRLSPVTTIIRWRWVSRFRFWRPSATRPRSVPSMTAKALRPAAVLPAALVGRNSHGYYGLSAPVSALVISRPILAEADYWFRRCSHRKFCAALGALWTPCPGVPGLELATLDVRPRWLPLSRTLTSGCGAGGAHYLASCFVPLPLSHLLREVDEIRVSRVRHNSLTIAASVTWASWEYGSPAPLARVPTKLGLMPATWGYPRDFGWVRTELPYQLWQTSFALRHGLAPRPSVIILVSLLFRLSLVSAPSHQTLVVAPFEKAE